MKFEPMRTLMIGVCEVAALGLLALCFVAALVETVFRGGKVLGDLEDDR